MVREAGRWLADAGHAVEEVELPRLGEAADLWHALVVDEERRGLAPDIQKFGDTASRRNIEAHLAYAPVLDGDQVLAGFERRMAIIRAWQLFLERYPIVVLPVSHRLPFSDDLDQTRDEQAIRSMMDAQRSLLAIPVIGLPSVAVPTSVAGGTPVGAGGRRPLSRRHLPERGRGDRGAGIGSRPRRSAVMRGHRASSTHTEERAP